LILWLRSPDRKSDGRDQLDNRKINWKIFHTTIAHHVGIRPATID